MSVCGTFLKSGVLGVALTAAACLPAGAETFYDWAETPTMGWNSWDFYGTSVNEEHTMAQADYMATNLLSHGWDLITVDIEWYRTDPTGFSYDWDYNFSFNMDEYGRLLPATNRFPSSVDGAGFKPLADYLHAQGLRLGIHIMRGIPRDAYDADTPILGTEYTAQDIADTSSTCSWNPDMYGVDMSKPGAQEYYNSLFDLYASWDVDFIKVDDLSRPYHSDEIEAIRAAIDQCGRPMVFSTSPGETPVGAGDHVMLNANQWRISDDFWDNWDALYAQFKRLHDWTPFRGPGYFPDADMLPIGKVDSGDPANPGRDTYFTADEHFTLMSLWSIARSPLIHGGDMTQMDPFTLSLMTNDEVIAVNQASTHNRQLFRSGDLIAWVADDSESTNKYLAVFNTSASTSNVPVDLTDLGYAGTCTVRDLWSHADVGEFSGTFAPEINPHGAGLYRLSGEVIPTPWLSDVSAVPGQISVSWEALAGAESYSLKRSQSEDGPFETIAAGLTGSAYTDTAVTNREVYYYVVSATVGGQQSPDSNVRLGVAPRLSAIIGWNWNSYGDAPTGASPSAGVAPVTSPYWNDTWADAKNAGTAMDNLRDDSGAATAVDISWSTVGTYSIQNSHPGADSDGTLNKEMLNGYLNAGGGADSTVTLSEIPYSIYDLYVYFSSDVSGRQGSVTDGSATYYFNTIGPNSISGGNAQFVQAEATTTAGYSQARNVAVFSGLSGASQTVSCSISSWGGIAAVQLVERVSPAVNSLSVSNGMMALSWTSDAYSTCELERSTNLVSGSWVPVATGLAGGNQSTNLPVQPEAAQEYFRVRWE